jgi:hypothetical protein
MGEFRNFMKRWERSDASRRDCIDLTPHREKERSYTSQRDKRG